MARKLREQRTLLQAHEPPTAEFVENFKVSQRLHQSLHAERKSAAKKELATLQKTAVQCSYVDEARRQPKPPDEDIVQQQELLNELRRDATHSGAREAENPVQKEKRMARREVFVASRKARHDEALENYERQMDVLADRCQAEAQEASEQMRETVRVAEVQIDDTLCPLEADTERLGERTEDEVRGIMVSLDAVIVELRSNIDEFEGELKQIDDRRREESVAMKRVLVDKLTAASHAVPGEVERIVEEKALHLNTALLENGKSIKTLIAKLTVNALEKSKDNKVRWHRGMLLWKQKRHRHDLELVMRRIQSNEFKQPDALEEILGRLRAQQRSTYAARSKLISEFFDTPIQNLQASVVRHWQDQDNSLNERTQDAYDALLAELKELKDSLEISGEGMLNWLTQELEAHDARSEWGEYCSCAELVDAVARPPLKECLDLVGDLIQATMEVLQKQDDTQHSVVSKLAAFFLALARKQENLKKRSDEFEVHYQGEVEDCEKDHEEVCRENEGQMVRYRDKINDAAHFDTLDEVKQEAFDYLDQMAICYRKHGDQLTAIHTQYPGNVATFFETETEGFCAELGLATEAAATAEDPTAELPGWPKGMDSGCKVLERETLDQLRERLVSEPVPTEEVASRLPVAADGDEPKADDEEFPRLADGGQVLEVLRFEEEWLEGRLAFAREKVFDHLGKCRKHLDRIDVEKLCDDVARDLDQVLRKHTNRKGEVQVELYVPRYATIGKHKDRFERHLVEIARKSQDHDDAATKQHKEVEMGEKSYQESLLACRTKLGEAETLPMLTAFERQSTELTNNFREDCQKSIAKVTWLATKAPQGLQKENEAFLTMCKSGVEQYSTTEITFYTSEMKELNAAIEERATARLERVRALEDHLEGMCREPLTEFMADYDKAVEQLCATKGLGTKHGRPRRNAQERCRTLIARAATVRQHIGELFDYFAGLCGEPADGAIEAASLPKCPLFRIGDFFHQTGEPWVFTAELTGTLYILACALNTLGTHLEAFKDDRKDRYKLDAMPAIRVLSELETLCTAEPNDAVSVTERRLRDDCLLCVMGPVLHEDSFNAEIKSIIKASHEAYASKGGTPQFMLRFLDDMKVSADKARQEAALGVREFCDALRDSTLLKLGDVLFGELTARSIQDLQRYMREAVAVSVDAWRDFDARRTAHERSLGPGLSNPNAEAELQALVEAEATRYKATMKATRHDRRRVVACLRERAGTYVQRLAANFEAAIRLVDALPLHSHFGTLPGDEQVEPPRMSIKRRMRRLSNDQTVDQHGDGLPQRQWEGVPKYELRLMLRGEPWRPDRELAEATPEMLAELTPLVTSFRSPVHKKLFERRSFYYQKYKTEFEAEVKRRAAELTAREDKERAGQRNWQSMVRQLNGDPGDGAESEDSEVAEERRLAEEAAAAAAMVASKPSGKGKK